MGSRTWQLLPCGRTAFAANPEEAVFARLFRRLLFWYVSLLAVLVILLGLGIGTTVPWIVFVSSEHDLSGQIAPLAQIWQNAPGHACPLSLPAQGYMLACYDERGQLIKSLGVVKEGPEKHFLGNSLALTALHESSAAQDALDESGTQQVQFDFVFLITSRPGMPRQALAVRKPGSRQILGIVQLGMTPAKTLALRQMIVDIFFTVMALAIVFGVPAGGWYLASKALLPARLAFQRQRDFIANVSHELGTPLALLRANAEVLLRNRSRLAEEDAALLEDIVAETTYMDKLTGNMLLLARMDAGQLRVEQEELDLGRLAEGVVRRAQKLADQGKITLTFQQNDTGIGIAPEDLSRLGERFYRADKARSRAVSGHGLGLSIVRGIVAAHRGQLTLTSEPGKGTSAIISLPATRQKQIGPRTS
jgi:signal transduction histidine kinase